MEGQQQWRCIGEGVPGTMEGQQRLQWARVLFPFPIATNDDPIRERMTNGIVDDGGGATDNDGGEVTMVGLPGTVEGQRRR